MQQVAVEDMHETMRKNGNLAPSSTATTQTRRIEESRELTEEEAREALFGDNRSERGIRSPRRPLNSTVIASTASSDKSVPLEPTASLTRSDNDEDIVSGEDNQRAQQEILEANARSVEVQQKKNNDILNRNMGSVVDVLRRSHDTQRSMDSSLKNIHKAVIAMGDKNKKDDKDGDNTSLDFDSLLANQRNNSERDTKPAPDFKVDVRKEGV